MDTGRARARSQPAGGLAQLWRRRDRRKASAGSASAAQRALPRKCKTRSRQPAASTVTTAAKAPLQNIRRSAIWHVVFAPGATARAACCRHALTARKCLVSRALRRAALRKSVGIPCSSRRQKGTLQILAAGGSRNVGSGDARTGEAGRAHGLSPIARLPPSAAGGSPNGRASQRDALLSRSCKRAQAS